MNFKDFVESYVKLLEEQPEFGDLEVWQYSDDEGNSVLPVYDSTNIGYIDKEKHHETDEYLIEDGLYDLLDYEEITLEEFLETHKQVILIG